MRHATLFFVIAAIVVLAAMRPGRAQGIEMPECPTCHSKNPKMVRMHEALDMKDCFRCHAREAIPAPPEREQAMRGSPLCSPCHGTAGKKR